jgi:hypothetical protein
MINSFPGKFITTFTGIQAPLSGLVFVKLCEMDLSEVKIVLFL